MSCSIALSNQTLVPLMNTAPLLLDTVSNPANRSPVLAASIRTASSCASPRTLIPSARTCLSFGHVVEVFCTQNDTNGGSSDTGTNVLAASPSRTPSTSAAMAITPDGKWPKASRSDVGVGPQPALPRIAAIHREDGVGRVRAPTRPSRQVRRQRQGGDLRVQSRVEEVRHREPISRMTQVHPVLGRPQIAAGR